jgi:CRISPR-associated protein Csx14
MEHWLDGEHSGTDNVKFWAGAGGYPGAALARDALSCLSCLEGEDWSEAVRDPFSFAAPMDSSFRFDWRRDYIPLDAGFSPNDQPTVGMMGYPLVELLAAVGLQYTRPARINPRDKLAYRYHVSDVWLPVALVRAVLGSDDSGFPSRSFRMRLGWPGKKGQARCIINAEEES